MDDATLQWANEVNSSHSEAESLQLDVDRLQDAVNDLTHTIQDLGMVRFDEDTEDYVILEQARQLWDTVSHAVMGAREAIQRAADDVNDIRRAVDFYGRG